MSTRDATCSRSLLVANQSQSEIPQQTSLILSRLCMVSVSKELMRGGATDEATLCCGSGLHARSCRQPSTCETMACDTVAIMMIATIESKLVWHLGVAQSGDQFPLHLFQAVSSRQLHLLFFLATDGGGGGGDPSDCCCCPCHVPCATRLRMVNGECRCSGPGIRPLIAVTYRSPKQKM